MASNTKMLVFNDVAKHNTMDDCWIIISGKVYDVTPYMDDHPGGGDIMRSVTRKDATIPFSDVGHSAAALEMMNKYYIGEIDQSTIPVKRSYYEKLYNSENTPQLMLTVLLFLVPIIMLGLAVTARAYTKDKFT
ncbi:cytochrome b5 [Tanacetum coccineum]